MSNHYDPSDTHSDAALYACAEPVTAWLVPGVVVVWGTWHGGVASATVTFVDSFHVTLVSPDGVSSLLGASCFRTLAQATSHLRPVVLS